MQLAERYKAELADLTKKSSATIADLQRTVDVCWCLLCIRFRSKVTFVAQDLRAKVAQLTPQLEAALAVRH